MRSVKLHLSRFVLVFAITVQSVVMAQAALIGFNAAGKSYGGIICSASGARKSLPTGHAPMPACCAGGCILSAALQIAEPDDNFLEISERSSEPIGILLALSLLGQYNFCLYDARSPPHRFS